MSVPFAESVTQHTQVKAADPDGLGNDVFIDADVPQVATLYPTPVSELTQGQDLTVIRLTAVFIPAIEALATDEFTARSKRWNVDGFPGQYDSPFTGRTVTQIHLTRVEG